MKRVFDRDALTGATEVFHYDEMTADITLETVNDVEPIINDNKRLLTQGDDGYSPSRDIRRVASIPMEVLLLWKQKYGVDVMLKRNEPLLRRLLNDPDWKYLRTAPGCM